MCLYRACTPSKLNRLTFPHSRPVVAWDCGGWCVGKVVVGIDVGVVLLVLREIVFRDWVVVVMAVEW